jgi:diaminopimelate epimerase
MFGVCNYAQVVLYFLYHIFAPGGYMQISFSKYHGAGNDFIIVDDRRRDFPADDVLLIKNYCHRRTGIGADGLMLLQNAEEADFQMQYYNSDGRPGTMCGNGARCILAFARDKGVVGGDGPFRFMAVDGLHEGLFCGKDQIKIHMRDVDNIRSVLGGFRVNTGSIHHVEYVDKLVDIDVVRKGAAIRNNPAYVADHGCNVNFVEVKEDGSLGIRTYERGVEDETLACGTGSVAAAIVHHAHGYHRKDYILHARGGDLRVSFNYHEGRYTAVYLEGPVKHVYNGEIQR